DHILLSYSPYQEYLFNSSHLLSSRHTSFGLFLASFATLYKSARCGLRWTTGKNSPVHSVLACMLATPTQFINPSTSVTLYLVWKCVEVRGPSCNRNRN